MCVTVYDTYSVDGVVVGMYFNLQNIKFPGIKSRRGVACRPYKSLLRPNNEYFRKTDYVIIRPLLHSLLDGGWQGHSYWLWVDVGGLCESGNWIMWRWRSSIINFLFVRNNTSELLLFYYGSLVHPIRPSSYYY